MEVKTKIVPRYNNLLAYRDGRIFNIDKKEFVKPFIMSNGYMAICLKGKIEKIHVLILETFSGNRPQSFQCRHLDGNKLNNNIENIKWGTPKENGEDRALHRKSMIDKEISSIDNNKIIKIKEMILNNLGFNEIVNKFNIHKCTIKHIKKQVLKEQKIIKKNKKTNKYQRILKLSDSINLTIGPTKEFLARQQRALGRSLRDISMELDIPITSLRRIVGDIKLTDEQKNNLLSKKKKRTILLNYKDKNISICGKIKIRVVQKQVFNEAKLTQSILDLIKIQSQNT